MQIDNEIYYFLFHPLSEKHSIPVKIFASVTVGALTILTAFTFLIPFIYFNWKDRKIRQISGPTKETEIKDTILPKIETKSKNETEIVKDILPKVESEKPITTVAKIKAKHTEYLALFEKWEAKKKWGNIHDAHYDWWMFPIDNRIGGRVNEYTVSDSDIKELKKDPEFMKNYLRGVVLVVRAWGWELLDEKAVSADNKTPEQKWTKWDVRLGKMADSLKLFEQDEYHAKLRIFAQQAILGNKHNLEPWVLDHLQPKPK